MITALPSQRSSYAGFIFMLVVCAVIFGALTWLNRFAAQKIEEQAQSFA
jgi:CHASE3 domain sensor protein